MRTRVLMNLPDPAPNHNGGQLVFGPDGFLWWGNGDGGGAGDQFGNGQRQDGYFAKIMRMDVDKRPARWSTWAVGLRNPWRFSFDRVGGALYIGDVGQGAWEEVDYVPRGRSHLNFGWNRYEGNAGYGDEQLLDGWTLTAPVHVYAHERRAARSPAATSTAARRCASAVGRYFFGDYCNGRVWSLRVRRRQGDGRRSASRSTCRELSSFGEDAAGELYLLSLGGPVYRLGRVDSRAAAFPRFYGFPRPPRRVTVEVAPSTTRRRRP